MKKFILFVFLMMATACGIFLSGLTFPTTVALSVFILAVISDFILTWICLKVGGREGNPVVAFLFRKVGIKATFVIFAGVWVCLVVFRLLNATEAVQTAVAITYWLVPVNNMMVLARLRRKNHVSS